VLSGNEERTSKAAMASGSGTSQDDSAPDSDSDVMSTSSAEGLTGTGGGGRDSRQRNSTDDERRGSEDDSDDDEIERAYQRSAASRGAVGVSSAVQRSVGPERPVVVSAESRAVDGAGAPVSFRERTKFIPLRLTHGERKYLRLLESALTVSEYTDHVDILSMQSKNRRIHVQLKDICAILSGLLVASDYDLGQELLTVRF
jgi:hypothetical protein